MIINNTAARLLLILLFAGWTGLPLRAENETQKPEQKPSQAPETSSQQAQPTVNKSAQEEAEDIWNEVSFESEENLQLTEKQVNQILEELKKKDPAKTEELQKLRTTDPEAFVKAIQEYIQSKKSDDSQDKQAPEKWKEMLNERHVYFLNWYKERYPDDYKELSQLKNTDPEKFAQKVIDLLKIYEEVQWMEERNPPLAEAMKKNIDLQKRRDALLLQIRISSKDEQEKLFSELKVIVSERFDTIVLEKQLQYEWLRSRLERLTQRLEERATELDGLKKSKDKSVDERLRELMERTETVNWN